MHQWGVSVPRRARKVTAVVGDFPRRRRLFLRLQVSQKVHLIEQKELNPMVPYLGTFFCRISAGKFAEVHEQVSHRGTAAGPARFRGTVVPSSR